MKIACMSDIHARTESPVYRKDAYVETQFVKMEQMIDECNSANVELLLLGGDIFDRASAWQIFARMALVLKKFEGKIIAVYGNHDMINHNHGQNHKTPLYALASALENFEIADTIVEYKGCEIYAGNWEKAPIAPRDNGAYKILLIHTMVIDQKLWEGQTGYTEGTTLLNKGYDLVVSGDNHQQFVLKTGRRAGRKLLVNSGSMMRNNIACMDFEPAYYIVDTGTQGVTRCPFSVAPATEVFDLEAIGQKKESERDLEGFSSFIDGVVSTDGKWLDFDTALHTALNEVSDTTERESIKNFIGGLNVETK